MAERLQWTLDLIDKMSGPGKNAAAAFERLTDAQVSSLAAARRVQAAEGKAAAALREVTAGTRRLTAEDLDLVDAQRKARREFDATAGAMDRVDASSNITGNLLQAAFWQGLARSILNAAQSIVRIGFELTRFSAQAVFALGKAAFDTAMWGEDTKSSLAVMAGSVEMGRAEFERMLETTTKLGIAVAGSIDAYKNLRAQGFAADEAEDLIKQLGTTGNYLAQPHTMKRCRTEFFEPTLSTRAIHGKWKEMELRDMGFRAGKMLEERLSEYEKPDMDPTLVKDLQAYVNERKGEKA